MEPDVSICIVSYNTRALLADCLESIHGSAPGCAFEVVVADNGSVDGSAAMVRERFPAALVIENRENLGFARGNNRALSRASGRFVVFLNSDTVVHAGALDALVGFMDRNPGALLAGPRLLNADGSVQQSCYKFPTLAAVAADNFFANELFPRNRLTGGYKYWAHDEERDVDWISGACMIGRRAELGDMGGFDENFFMYGEETELCLRARRAGWKALFTPEAVVTHLGGGSSDRDARAFREIVYVSNDYYYRKHYGAAYNFGTKLVWLTSSMLKLPLLGLAALIGSGSGSGRAYHAERMRYFLGSRLWSRLY